MQHHEPERIACCSLRADHSTARRRTRRCHPRIAVDSTLCLPGSLALQAEGIRSQAAPKWTFRESPRLYLRSAPAEAQSEAKGEWMQWRRAQVGSSDYELPKGAGTAGTLASMFGLRWQRQRPTLLISFAKDMNDLRLSFDVTK